MQLSSATAGIPGRRIVGDGATVIDSVAYRSDRVESGALFCCLRGVNTDGHNFAGDAARRGAGALLVERELAVPLPQVVVPDARLAMALVAARLAECPSRDLAVVGITGTNGKTTSAFIMRAILQAAGRSCGMVGTVETRVGGSVEAAGRTTPESVDLQALLTRMRAAGDAACAMEVSSHALVQRRVAGVEFAAALFTNLTRDHLDYHSDVEDYFAAKRRLFSRPQGEGPDPPGAFNVDDPFGARLHRELGGVDYAADASASVRPRSVELRSDGVTARVQTPRGPIELHSRLRARFNLANLLGCVAVSEILGIDHEPVRAGIASMRGVPGRLEPIECGQDFQVLVDYAHTPDSLENVVRAARELAAGGRVGVVFGCGGDRDRGKRGPMGRAVRTLADYGVVTSDNPRGEDPDAIIDQIVTESGEGPASFEVEEDRRRAIARAFAWASEGDVIVIAGKGHEDGQERNGVTTPFDDREVARDELGGACA